jgi:hypothetical protein
LELVCELPRRGLGKIRFVSTAHDPKASRLPDNVAPSCSNIARTEGGGSPLESSEVAGDRELLLRQS